MALNKLVRLNKHTTATTSGVIDATMIGLDYLHDQFNDTSWGEELTTVLARLQRELAQKVLINFSKGIPFYIIRNIVKAFKEIKNSAVTEALI